MPSRTSSRVLFLDDSGKPSYNDSTQAVVIGGFSVPSAVVPVLSGRIAGAKRRCFPGHGDPSAWEVKSTQLLKPRRMKRSRNSQLLSEMLRILSRLGCTVYTASIDKRRTSNEMSNESTMLLLLQALAEHFAVECRFGNEVGLLVSDWSSHRIDARASHGVARFVTSNRLPIHPGVYYADSLGSQALQVADLIAGARRRSLEGDSGVQSFAVDCALLGSLPVDFSGTTHSGRAYKSEIVLI